MGGVIQDAVRLLVILFRHTAKGGGVLGTLEEEACAKDTQQGRMPLTSRRRWCSYDTVYKGEQGTLGTFEGVAPYHAFMHSPT